MRRIFVLIIALAMFLVVPMATASAQDDRFEATIRSSGMQVGVNDQGGAFAEATFEVIMGGAVVETGVVSTVTYPSADGAVVRFFSTYVDDSTGNVVNTFGKTVLVAGDAATGIFRYIGTERILSSTTGVMGHARGYIDVTIYPDAPFEFEGEADWILNF